MIDFVYTAIDEVLSVTEVATGQTVTVDDFGCFNNGTPSQEDLREVFEQGE
jgi:hypothetical protein